MLQALDASNSRIRSRWNGMRDFSAPRAGRIFAAQLISLNPRLREHDRRRSTARCGMSWLICSPNSAPAAAGSRRTEPNGEKRAGTWELATNRALMLCPFRFNGARAVSFINARAAERSFRACAESNERSPVWIVAGNSTAENSIRARSCDWWRTLRSQSQGEDVTSSAQTAVTSLGASRDALAAHVNVVRTGSGSTTTSRPQNANSG